VMLVVLDSNVPQFNRRHLHQGAQSGVIVCFLALTVLLAVSHEGVAILVINLIGTVFIEYTWDACYLCAVEAMPTSVRASAMGSCSLMARVGAILSPTLSHLSRWWAPSAYLAVTTLAAVNLLFSWLFLPDTKQVHLDNVHLTNAKTIEQSSVDGPEKGTAEIETSAMLIGTAEGREGTEGRAEGHITKDSN